MTPVWRQVLVWLAAIAVIGLTASLGNWQLHRADQKRQAHADMMARQQQVPWSGADWPCDASHDPATLPVQRPVMLRGHWLVDRTVFLDNRPMDSISGFIVVTPLRLSDTQAGCAQGTVLVERGWVPRDLHDRLKVPPVPTPSGEVWVMGRVSRGVSEAYRLGQEPTAMPGSGPFIRQNADAAFWSTWLGQAPLAGAVVQLQAVDPSAPSDGLRRHWPEPGQGQDKHLAYAAQWFAMSATVAGLTLWFQIIRPRRQSRHVHS